jgi:hypothetical protein
MSSLRRILASQANGRLSRGPKTPEGKLRSSKNAAFHGLSANSALLSGEDRERFNQLHQSFLETFAPASDAEALLIEQMAVAQWKLRRLWSMESAALDHQMDRMAGEIDATYERIDPPTRLALAFSRLADNGRALSTLERYQSRIQRDYYRAAAELEYLQNRRAIRVDPICQNEPNAPAVAAAGEPPALPETA